MIKKMFFAIFAIGILTTSCSKDDDGPATGRLILDFSESDNKLESLGDDYVYEGWIIVDGSPVSTGTFSSVTFPQTFTVDAAQLKEATTFVLSIEPKVDPDPAPAATKILAGDFSGSSAAVSSTGIVGDFSSASGKYILATPTDTDDSNEASGVWFLDNTNAPPPVAGLSLPTLPDGWKYEGWAVIGGNPITTGTFTKVASTDDAAPFSGPVALPTPNGADGFFPGEDFLQNAPAGVTFPTDLKGAKIVISVEPSPDNSPAPFTLKPLAHDVPGNAANHTVINMGTGPVVSLSGTVSR